MTGEEGIEIVRTHPDAGAIVEPQVERPRQCVKRESSVLRNVESRKRAVEEPVAGPFHLRSDGLNSLRGLAGELFRQSGIASSHAFSLLGLLPDPHGGVVRSLARCCTPVKGDAKQIG